MARLSNEDLRSAIREQVDNNGGAVSWDALREALGFDVARDAYALLAEENRSEGALELHLMRQPEGHMLPFVRVREAATNNDGGNI